MGIVDLIAIGVWVLAGAGIWLLRTAVRVPPTDRRRWVYGNAGVLLLCLPVLLLVVIFPRHSVTVLATEYILMGVIGGLMLVGARRMDLPRYQLILLVVLGCAGIGWSVWHIAGDFLLRRARVEGYVTEKGFEKPNASCMLCRPDYFVYISGRRYRATTEVFEAAESGQRVRARFGRASRRLIGLQIGSRSVRPEQDDNADHDQRDADGLPSRGPLLEDPR
jgi:hypothetical protein